MAQRLLESGLGVRRWLPLCPGAGARLHKAEERGVERKWRQVYVTVSSGGRGRPGARVGPGPCPEEGMLDQGLVQPACSAWTLLLLDGRVWVRYHLWAASLGTVPLPEA